MIELPFTTIILPLLTFFATWFLGLILFCQIAIQSNKAACVVSAVTGLLALLAPLTMWGVVVWK